MLLSHTWGKLKKLVEDCDKLGLVVDVTLTRAMAPLHTSRRWTTCAALRRRLCAC